MQENTKQVIVKMTARRAFRTEPIWQYDTGHELVFEGFDGLPATFQVHFSLSPMGQSITQVGQNGVCTLPDMYTRTAAPIYAWLYIAETDTGLTKYSIEIPVQRRAKITDQQPTPVEQSAIDQAIAALNAGAAAAEDAQEAAEAAQASAESYAESAGNSAITATNAATSAAASATSAAGSATAAAASATDANSSREAADVSATAAGVSERNAKSSETAAAGSAASAASSASAASGSATAAGSAKDSAAASATAAAGSATAASGSASAAAESATAAAGSATSAGTSATAAAGSATAAAGSATAAGQSATAAAGSAAAAQEVLESIPEDYSDLSDDVDSLKSAFESLDDEVHDPVTGLDGKAPVIINTASGDIASFDDGADGMPIKGMTVSVEPVQDLHGQDAPYPPGGGKNKADYPGMISAGAVEQSDGSLYVGTSQSYTGTVIFQNDGTEGQFAITFIIKNDGASRGIYPIIHYTDSTIESFPVNLGYTTFTTFTKITNSGKIVDKVVFGYGTSTTKNWFYIQVESGSTATAWSPYSNVCPITGWTGATVRRTGKNLLTPDKYQYTSTQVRIGTDGTTGHIYNTYLKAGVTYTLSVISNVSVSCLGKYVINGEAIQFTIGTNGGTFTIPVDSLCLFWCYKSGSLSVDDITQFQLEVGSTATAYEPYQGTTYPITFPSEAGTVYGGSLTVNEDGTGQLVVDRAIITLDGTQTQQNSKYDGTHNAIARWNLANPAKSFSGGVPDAISDKLVATSSALIGNFVAWSGNADLGFTFTIAADGARVGIAIPLSEGIANATQMNAWLSNNPVTICYELATPLTYSLTATQITTLLGSNRIWADCGAVSVDYCADTKAYVDDAIPEIPEVPVRDVQVNGTSVLNNGVANVETANSGRYGVVVIATSTEVKAGTQPNKPITPNTQKYAAFYGLAEAAGDTTTKAVSGANLGVYTETGKSKIHEMLNGSVSVSGTTPSITAMPGVRYVCGEVATLDVTVPASGIVDIVFESGSTATVLTITGTVKWANGFDPASLDANTTYEINIADGLGVAASWT